ncbi:MAG: transferrin receptor-like dimerization domain-containing protein [Bryobacteraceae bacterium]
MRPFAVLLSLACVCLAADSSWEEKFRAIPDAQNLRADMQRLTARPHHVGSPYDKANAEWIVSKLKSWGLDAEIENFDVLFPTPKQRQIEMIEPQRYSAKLEEPAIAVDPTSNQKSEQLPPYNAYSIDGEATAPLVYVNYGIPADYEQLDRMGISVKGAIVIARYGASWRGIKPKVAAEHGSVACIIYSDPRDDGYAAADVFPNGPARPRFGVQRGSVQDMPVYPGDPLSPGFGSVPGAKRLPISEAKTLTKIPVLPISYGDAQPLLAALKGPVAPQSWRGGLPITYHIGPGPAKVHMKAAFNWDTKRLYDVIVRIPGSEYPDEWVIRGNHHDAWVNGADDPSSGASAQLEEMRAFGELLKQGWKPKRTIIYAFWDGEEPGLLGSTEWGETHADELEKHAVVYINSDNSGRGFLLASGSHSLEDFMNGVMKDVKDPETNGTLWQRARDRAVERAAPDRKNSVRARADLRINALGSGSDYTVFIDHLGIASLDLGFGGEGPGGGVYHSTYDDFYWYTHFSDKNFVYGRALAQTAGTAVMRLADADLIPLQFGNFADTLGNYLDELKKLAANERRDLGERNRELDEGVFAATADPERKEIAPAKETVPALLDFAPLDSAVAAFSDSAKRYDSARSKAAAANVREVNAKLIESERDLTDSAGLPSRPWYRNLIYAPGLYTGYGVKTIPGVREAIEQKQWTEAQAQIERVSGVLIKEAALLDSAAADLSHSTQQ